MIACTELTVRKAEVSDSGRETTSRPPLEHDVFRLQVVVAKITGVDMAKPGSNAFEQSVDWSWQEGKSCACTNRVRNFYR